VEAGAAGAGIHVVALYVVVLWVPGLLLGWLAGMRGWTLAAGAPLLTYTVAGLAGPAFSAARISWTPASAGVLLAILTAGAAALRWSARRRNGATEDDVEAHWAGRVHLAVAAALTAVVVFGAVVIWTGIGRLSAVPQDWDAAFHANGIRWIADTGDSSLVGMGSVNWYEDGVHVYYPNAYHLVAATVLRLTSAGIPTVLNAQTVLLPGICALVVVALVHRLRGRAVLAVAAAACSVSITSFYDMLWRGPLLPFVTGAALMPLVAVLVLDLLDAGTGRSRMAPGLLFASGLVGLICLNPATLFSAVLFVVPALGQRWASRPSLLRREPLVILGAGVVAAVLALPQLLASLGSAEGAPFDWPATLSQLEAVGQLLTLSHGGLPPQWCLVVAAAVGLARYGNLSQLRWIGVAGAAFGALFVLSASSDAFWVNAITRPWWNDRWRLIGLCVVPIAVVAGHGLAELQRSTAAALGAAARMSRGDSKVTAGVSRAAPIVAVGIVGALFVGASNDLYVDRNVARMRLSAPDGPVVSSLEVDAMHALAAVVPAGQRVLNDRGDGSAWMYAIAGVLPVAGHYNASRIGPDAQLLADRFNRYPDDPAVQAAIERLNISYVMLDRGFVRSSWSRAPGLVGLDGASWLDKVYENPDAVIYRIRSGIPSRP
jgi:hypothetical protein